MKLVVIKILVPNSQIKSTVGNGYRFIVKKSFETKHARNYRFGVLLIDIQILHAFKMKFSFNYRQHFGTFAASKRDNAFAPFEIDNGVVQCF